MLILIIIIIKVRVFTYNKKREDMFHSHYGVATGCFAALFCVACTASTQKEDSGLDTGEGTDTGDVWSGDTYEFVSALTGEDSVSYTGQVFRHLLVHDLGVWTLGLTDRIDSGALSPSAGDVEQELFFYLEFDSSTAGTISHLLTVDGVPLQQTYDDVSSGKNLLEKLAGNDTVTDHQDWSEAFVGWDDPDVTSPESLVRHWVSTIDEQAVQRANGTLPADPFGVDLDGIHLTADGHDLQALMSAFLLGAIGFQQGADDYLDDDTDGKGLLANHQAAEDGKAYTALEHAWDEGFGYWGASRTMPQHTDEDLTSRVGWDVDGDGVVDLTREVNWGHVLDAAHRDQGSAAVLDLTNEAWQGFAEGRQLLASTAGNALSESQLQTLQEHRDVALLAWERTIAATVISSINETIAQTQALGTAEHDFSTHARSWSLMKGHALGLQFNPHSPLSDTDCAELHSLFGMAPIFAEDAGAAHVKALLEARALLVSVYGFGDSDVGAW